MSEVADIYNNLFNFESKQKSKSYPIHKRLDLGGEYADLLDWIMSKVTFDSTDYVLDAGCGTGYSLIRLAKERGVKGKGISLSENEINFATATAVKEGVKDQIFFNKASFDNHLDGSFDKIIAIESLKHSLDINSSVINLIKSMPKLGSIIIADDFQLTGNDLLQRQKSLWRAPGFISLEQLELILDKNGEFEIQRYDLTKKVRIRSEFLLRTLIFFTNIMRSLSTNKYRIYIDVYLGGLLLEYLYIKKAVSYQVIIATKRI